MSAKDAKFFIVMDKGDILQFSAFDGVLCFGNILPHLPDEVAIHRFFSSVYQSLHNDGVFIVEVLNYDRILAEKKQTLEIKKRISLFLEGAMTEKFKNPHFFNKDRDSAVNKNNKRPEYIRKA